MDLLVVLLLTKDLYAHFLAVKVLVDGFTLEVWVLYVTNFGRFVTWVDVTSWVVLELV